MKTRELLAGAVVALVLLLGVGSVQAGFLVQVDGTGTNATGILNLEVDGVLYDVEFDYDFGLDIFGAPPFTFNLELQAINANEEVNAALNSVPAVVTVGPMMSDHYAIPFEFENLDYAVRGSEYSLLDQWQQVPNAQVVDGAALHSYAVFTVVPAPATMCVFGPAIFALGGRRRRRTK
ncbi:MAG: hypothetical protein ACYTGM_20025 [Planctomycetota bacterium]|jgi:hypothetical protein